MSSSYFFQGFERNQHLEDFIRQKTQPVVDSFIPTKSYKLIAKVHTSRARGQSRGPLFFCQLILDDPTRPSLIIVKKENSCFYETVIQATTTLKRILKRRSGIKLHQLRRQYKKITNKLQNAIHYKRNLYDLSARPNDQISA